MARPDKAAAVAELADRFVIVDLQCSLSTVV